METIVAYSDCLDVKVSHDETRTISYSNENDFAGISYSVAEPPVFVIRIHSKFFKERFPEDNESESLSSGEVVKLSGTVKTQKQLQIEPVPYYFHQLLKLVLQHNYILIDGIEWEKEDGYEMKELNEGFPLESAECWMTQKEDGYFTNVYGTV